MSAFHPLKTTGDLVQRIVRVLLIGVIIGIASSLAAQAMVWLVQQGSQWITVNKNTYPGVVAILMTILIPAIGGLIVGHIVHYMSTKRAQTPADVILAVQSNLKLANLKFKDGILNFIASTISLTSGASLGQYGPIVNMGATLARHLHRIAKTEHSVLIGCGVAAAISSAFSAPIAGIIFAHEVILRHYSLRAFAPITIAASTGFYLSKFVFFAEPLFELPFVEILFLGEFAGFIAIGIVAGLVSVIFLHAILYSRLLADRLPMHDKFKPMLAGLVVGLVALQLPEVLGIGGNALRGALYNTAPLALDVGLLMIAKLLLAALCLGFGFVGGVFSPALLVGVLFGSLFGLTIEVFFPYSNIAVYAVCGMAAVTSPIIGAPLTTILIVFELTQSYELTTAVMISVVFSNVVSYRLFGRSLFDFQLKSRSYDLANGRDPLILSTQHVGELTRKNYTTFKPDTTVKQAMHLLVEASSHEGFLVEESNQFSGMVEMLDLVKHIHTPDKQLDQLSDIVNKNVLRFSANTSIWDAMRDIRGFVGERVPIIDESNGHLKGVIYEADLIETYLRTIKALRNEETANA